MFLPEHLECDSVWHVWAAGRHVWSWILSSHNFPRISLCWPWYTFTGTLVHGLPNTAPKEPVCCLLKGKNDIKCHCYWCCLLTVNFSLSLSLLPLAPSLLLFTEMICMQQEKNKPARNALEFPSLSEPIRTQVQGTCWQQCSRRCYMEDFQKTLQHKFLSVRANQDWPFLDSSLLNSALLNSNTGW